MERTLKNTENKFKNIIAGAVHNWNSGNRMYAINAVGYDYGHSPVAAYLAVKIANNLSEAARLEFMTLLGEKALNLVGPT